MTRADVALIAVAWALVGALFAAYWQPARAAATVELRSGSGVVGSHPLAQDRRIEVAGRLGPSVVEIRDGRARFVASPCRNHVCVRAGWLWHDGDVVACVPNRVSLRLSGGAESGLDAISR